MVNFSKVSQPWLQSGTKVKPATKSLIKSAHLDFEVEKQPIFLKNKVRVPEKFATVRTDTKDAIGVVGERYKIIQNKDALAFFDLIVKRHGAKYAAAGSIRNGERIWVLAQLPGRITVNSDVVKKYLILTNNHNGMAALQIYFSPIRVENFTTLNVSLPNIKEGISIRHIGKINDKIAESKRIFGITKDYYREFAKITKRMARTKLNPKKTEQYFNSLLGIRGKGSTRILNQRKELMKHLKSRKPSLWSVYNAVTEYVDLERTVKNEKQNSSNRLDNIWFGVGARFKEKAFKKAVELI